MNLGTTIKNVRQQKGIQQNSLAGACGITQAYLSQIESNAKEPKLSTLQAIAEVLETPLPILFFLSLDENDIKAERKDAFNLLAPSMKSTIADFFIGTSSQKVTPVSHVINTPKHLAFRLNIDINEIEAIIENIDNFYDEWMEVKTDKDGNPKLYANGDEKKRVYNPSLKRLKVIQSRILKNILSNMPLPDYAFGGVKGKDNVMNAAMHKGKKYIFTTDLKDFYPSISHRQVFEMFRSFDFSPEVSRRLTQLTTYKGRLPQGAPTSSSIANLVFIKTGKKLQAFASENKITFTSFVDDLTFSAPADFKSKAQLIIDTLQEDGFSISHSKTNYKTKKPIVTGVEVNNNSLKVTGSFKRKLKNMDGKTPEQRRGLRQYETKVMNANK
jgi:RNA-directed DNA polymerase